MKKINYWTQVTPLSKTLAMILFVAFPFLGFWFGTYYQKSLDSSKPKNNANLDMVTVNTPFKDARVGIKIDTKENLYVEKAEEKGYDNSMLRQGIVRFGYSSNWDKSGIQIDYGIPSLEGKGGACENWSKYTIAGVVVDSTCISPDKDFAVDFIGYPKNPKQGIEYAIWVSGTKIEREKYHQILKNNFSWF